MAAAVVVAALLAFVSGAQMRPVSGMQLRVWEASALLRVKAEVAADPRGALGSWARGAACGQWEGVTCDAAGRVIALKLPSQGLHGRLGESLGELTLLRELNLSANRFFGDFPSSLRNLQNLQFLDLSNNRLRGKLPKSIRYLNKLVTLDVSNNLLSGPLPGALGRLRDLKILRLHSNQFRGRLLDSIGNLKNLEELDASMNRFSSGIPEAFGKLQNLKILRLSSNGLRGTIPDSLGDLKDLLHLDLSRNGLRGAVPSALARLANLEELRLARNWLSGGVSLPFPSAALTTLDLAHNCLTGPVTVTLAGVGMRANCLRAAANQRPPAECGSALSAANYGRERGLAGAASALSLVAQFAPPPSAASSGCPGGLNSSAPAGFYEVSSKFFLDGEYRPAGGCASPTECLAACGPGGRRFGFFLDPVPRPDEPASADSSSASYECWCLTGPVRADRFDPATDTRWWIRACAPSGGPSEADADDMLTMDDDS